MVAVENQEGGMESAKKQRRVSECRLTMQELA